MVERFRHPIFALQYDLSEGDRSRCGDREWYAAELGGCGGRVLELAAGSGRITKALADAGLEVYALDVAHAMLARMPPRQGVRRVCADMRRLPLRGPFAGACCGYNSLGCLLTREDLRRCMEEVARVLAPGAPFLFDVSGPVESVREAIDGQEWCAPDGTVVRRDVRMRIEGDLLHMEYRYRWEGGGATVPFSLNLWPVEVYTDAARAAGLAVEAVETRQFRDGRDRERTWPFVSTRRGAVS